MMNYSKFIFMTPPEGSERAPKAVSEKQYSKREAIKITSDAMRAARKGEDLMPFIKKMAKNEKLQKLFVVSQNLKLMKAVAEKTTSVAVMVGLRAVLRFTKGAEGNYKAAIKAFVDNCNKSTNPKIAYLMQGMAGFKVENPKATKLQLYKYFRQRGMSSGKAKTEARRRLRDIYPRNIKLSKMILAKYAKKDSAVMIELIKSGSRDVQSEAVKSDALKNVRVGTLKVLLRAVGHDASSIQIFQRLAQFDNLNDRVVALMWGTFDHLSGDNPLKGAAVKNYQLGLAISKHKNLSDKILTKMVNNINAPSIREKEVIGRNLASHPKVTDALVVAMWKRFPAVAKDRSANQNIVANKNISDKIINQIKQRNKNPKDRILAGTIKQLRPNLS